MGIKIPGLKAGHKEDNKLELILPDKFQFKLSHFNGSGKFSELNVFKKADKECIEKGVEDNFTKTDPFASLIYVEFIIQNLRKQQYEGTLSDLELVEYDYPSLDERSRKKNKHPQKEIVDSFNMQFKFDRDTLHLPQIIAEYFMNYESKEAGYDARVSYIEDILKNYSQIYGVLFKKLFGVMPEKSVDLPPEAAWHKKFEKGIFIQVAALYDSAKMSGNSTMPSTTQKNASDKESVHTNTTNPTVNTSEKTEVVSVPNPPEARQPMPTHVQEEVTSQVKKFDTQPIEKDQKFKTGQFPTPASSGAPKSMPTRLTKTMNNQRYRRGFVLEEEFKQLDKYRNMANLELPDSCFGVVKDVPQTDPDYVLYQVNRKRQLLHQDLQTAIEGLNTSAEARLGSEIDQFKTDIQGFVAKHNKANNVAEQARNVVEPLIKQERQTEYKNQLARIDQQELDNQEVEDKRHQTELTRIKAQASQLRDALDGKLDSQFKTAYDEKYAQVLAETTEKAEKDKEDQLTAMLATYSSKLQTSAETLQQQSIQFIANLKTQQEQEIAEYEAQQQKIHAEAQQREIALSTNDSLLKNYDNLAQQLEIAEGRNDDLNAQVNKLMAENQGLRANINAVSNEKAVASPQVAPGVLSNEVIAELIKAATSKTQSTPVTQTPVSQDKTRSSHKGATVAAIIVALLAGGAGAFGYQAYNDQVIEAKSKAQASSRKQSEKIASLESKVATKKSSKTEATKSTATTDYKQLDAALANNDLSVYLRDFKGKSLGDNDQRVLKVGQLFVQQGNYTAAKQVSVENPDHNQLLNTYLGI